MKSVLVQFDVPAKELEGMGVAGSEATSAGGNDSDVCAQLTQLHQLAKGLVEEMQGEIEEEPLENHQQDDNDSWIDERRGMSGEDLQMLVQDVMPVRCMLVKVCRCLCVHVGPLCTLPHSLTLGQGLHPSLHPSCSSVRQPMDSRTHQPYLCLNGENFARHIS